MQDEGPSEEDRARFRKMMNEMIAARLEMFSANAPKYAEALGTFRTALQKSGFSPEESMQIILKVAELPGSRPFFGRRHGGHWHKHGPESDKLPD
jgi:hypothetical protein